MRRISIWQRAAISIATVFTLLLAATSVSALAEVESKPEFEYEPMIKVTPVLSEIAISDATAKYQTDAVKGFLGSTGIKCMMKLENRSKGKVVAVQLGFVFFNYFNEPLGYQSALVLHEIDAGEIKDVSAKFKFATDKSAYPLFVFVHKIKYLDRRVVTADMSKVSAEINKSLGTNWGAEMFEDPEVRRGRKFDLMGVVGFLL